MCEISDKFVDINLCSCAAVSDVDHIYNTLIQSFKGFIVDLLADDIRYLDDVVRGDDAYQFKTSDNATYLVLEEKEELLTRRLGHLNLDCHRQCCNSPGGQKLSRDELLDQGVEDLGLTVHGRVQNQHQNKFIQGERRKKKELQYMNESHRIWEEGKRVGRTYGKEVKKKKERTFRALNPGPLMNYLVEKPKEKTLEEVDLEEVDPEVKKKKEQARKVKIGKRSFGKMKFGDFLKEEGMYHEDSDPDWEPTDTDKISSEDYTEGEEEDLDQLNRDAMLPLVEVLKDAKISLRTLMIAELAHGYQKVAMGVSNGVLSEKEAFDEMRKLKKRFEKEYGVNKKDKQHQGGSSRELEDEDNDNDGVDDDSVTYPYEEGLPESGSLTSGGNEVEKESAQDKEIRQFNALKNSIDEVEKMRQARGRERDLANENPGILERFTRALSGDREGGEGNSINRENDQ